jgi:hypothetical protein
VSTETGLVVCNVILNLAYCGVGILGSWVGIYFGSLPPEPVSEQGREALDA